jgi:hypothetical protein
MQMEMEMEVTPVPWWGDMLFALAVVLAIKGFLALIGVETRWFTRRTYRTAEDIYPNYADSARKQHRYAREHGGQWRDQGNSSGRSTGTSS